MDVRYSKNTAEDNYITNLADAKHIILWVFRNGKIEKKEGASEDNHFDLFGDVYDYFRGRYNPADGVISILKPNKRRFRDVPSIVIRRVEQAFPEAKKIDIYEAKQNVRRHNFTTDKNYFQNYLRIGHSPETEPLLWIYKDGRIETKQVEGGMTHGEVWGYSEYLDYFRGRYDPATEEVSIAKPRRAAFRDVPSVIMRALREKFPKAKEFHVFEKKDRTDARSNSP